jgi:Protein of unknown function (DUF3987)
MITSTHDSVVAESPARSVESVPPTTDSDDDRRGADILVGLIAGRDVPATTLKTLRGVWRDLSRFLAPRPQATRQAECSRWLNSLPAGEANRIQSAITAAQGRLGGLEAAPAPWGPPRLPGSVPVPAAAFPLDTLPDALAQLVNHGVAIVQAPPDYFAAPALGLAGIAIGLSVVLRVANTWNERADLAIAVTGPPGTRKSAPLKLLSSPLSEIDAELRDQYREAVADYEHLVEHWTTEKAAAKKGGHDPGPKPIQPVHGHLTLDDCTQESIARIHSDNPRGVGVIMDELSAWIASLNAYRSGKGADRQFWLKVRSGSLIKVTRKGSDDPIVLPAPMVPVVGCMTPSGLPAMCGGPSDGWADRILFACPDPADAPPRRFTEEDVPQHLIDAWRAAIRRLFGRPMVESEGRPRPYYVRFTPAGKARWATFINEHAAESESPEFDPSLAGAHSKLEGYCARLALILSQLRWAYDPAFDSAHPSVPPDVDELDVQGAVRLVHYFANHLQRVRAQLSGGDGLIPPDALAVLAWVRRHSLTRFTANQVNEKLGRFRRAPERRAAALQWLTERSCIRPLPTPPRTGPGHPPTPEYEVNPLLGTRAVYSPDSINPDNSPEDSIS